MKADSSIDMRLKIYLRREEYVWLHRRGKPALNFGWIIAMDSSAKILFKDDESARTVSVPVAEIECCGAV